MNVLTLECSSLFDICYWHKAASLSEYECDGCARPTCNQHHHSQRKPLAKSPSEKRPTLNVQCARNSLSQWPTRATSAANLRKSRHNFR